jgi:hypothetical protein
MNKRTKTQSKQFFDDEIHHVEIDENGNKIFHLHEWVHRTYNPNLLDYDRIRHRNDIIDIVESYRKAYLKLFGGDDFSQPGIDDRYE